MGRFSFARFNRTQRELPGRVGTEAAVALFRSSGFEAFESGGSFFDSPVLVYVPDAGRRWPNFFIHDHEGVTLGRTRSEPVSRGVYVKSSVEIRDRADLPCLHLQVFAVDGGVDFKVRGRATADIVARQPDFGRLSIEANNEPFGVVDCPSPWGVDGPELTVFDHRNRQVGTVRSVSPVEAKPRSPQGFVLSLSPNLDGELRRAVVSLPIVVEVLRTMQRRTIDSVRRARGMWW